MKFKQFLNEEPYLEPKLASEFKKIGKKVDYQSRYNNIFPKDKDRIYLPLSGSITTELNYDLESEIDILSDKHMEYLIDKIDDVNGKTITDYDYNADIKNGVVKFNLEIETELKNEKFKKEKKKIVVSIDKILKDKYLRMWKNSAFRRGPKFDNLNIVISRKPEDIGSMSTNTGWKSCMNLHGGCYNSYTRQDVKEGTLIAYLIDVKDKDIMYPIGRVLLKPYKNVKEGENGTLLNVGKVYGEFPSKYLDVLKAWLKEKQKGVKGIFTFNNKLYNDYEKQYISGDKEVKFKIGDRVKIVHEENKDFVGEKGTVDKIGIVDKIGTYININVKLDNFKTLGVKFRNVRPEFLKKIKD